MSSPDEVRAALQDRYGVPDPGARRRRRVLVLAAGVIAVIGFVVLAVVSTNEPIRTDEASFRVVDDTAVEVDYIVHMDPGTKAECTVLALNARFGQVGVAHQEIGPVEQRSTPVTTRVVTTEPASGARVASCRELPEG